MVYFMENPISKWIMTEGTSLISFNSQKDAWIFCPTLCQKIFGDEWVLAEDGALTEDRERHRTHGPTPNAPMPPMGVAELVLFCELVLNLTSKPRARPASWILRLTISKKAMTKNDNN